MVIRAMKEINIEKSIRQMQLEIEQLEIKIQKMKSEEKSKGLKRTPFFAPLIKAFIATLIVLLIFNQCAAK
jgi:hypothetical protein